MLAETASMTSAGQRAVEQRVAEAPGRALEAGHLRDQVARRVPRRREARRVVVADAPLRRVGPPALVRLGNDHVSRKRIVPRLAGCECGEGAHATPCPWCPARWASGSPGPRAGRR